MKRLTVESEEGFTIVAGTDRSQAATMVIDRGGCTGGPDNQHPKSDQWLYVLSGSATATVKGEKVKLTPGTLLLIEAGEAHEIVNNGGEPFRTLNIYTPPAY
jgi:mannose-6-phosphate isomerase-like protein (cupin superfamily)